MAWPGDRVLLIVRPPACRYVRPLRNSGERRACRANPSSFSVGRPLDSRVRGNDGGGRGNDGGGCGNDGGFCKGLYVSIRRAHGVSAMPQSAPLGNEKRAVVWPQGSAFAPWSSLRPRPSRAWEAAGTSSTSNSIVRPGDDSVDGGPVPIRGFRSGFPAPEAEVDDSRNLDRRVVGGHRVVDPPDQGRRGRSSPRPRGHRLFPRFRPHV